jgi:hypothetical protein
VPALFLTQLPHASPPPPPGPLHPPTHPPSCRYNKLLSDLHTAAEAAAQQSGQARPQVDPQLSLFADTFLAQLLHPEMAAQAVEVSRAGGEGGGRADGGSQQQVTALRKLCRTAYVLHQRCLCCCPGALLSASRREHLGLRRWCCIIVCSNTHLSAWIHHFLAACLCTP